MGNFLKRRIRSFIVVALLCLGALFAAPSANAAPEYLGGDDFDVVGDESRVQSGDSKVLGGSDEYSPFLDAIIVEGKIDDNGYAVEGFSGLQSDRKLVETSNGGVRVKVKGKVFGDLSDPFAVDANGKVLESHYEVHGNVIRQVVNVGVDASFPVTLAPAIIRKGHKDDIRLISAYHQFFREVPVNKSMSMGGAEGTLLAQSRAAGVSIPGNYVYNTKHSRKSLHDYCTMSPDSWFNADFRGSCARHDMCIEGNLGKSKAVQKSLRKGCDLALGVNLTTSCRTAYGPGVTRNSCSAVAASYYAVVSVKTWTT
ncbi:hypothetical protein CVV67_02670 [Arthrobacter stackebrandtii]|nr:hypothetical protein CVV67_02670 [Arthrobacter stackebrandtii]